MQSNVLDMYSAFRLSRENFRRGNLTYDFATWLSADHLTIRFLASLQTSTGILITYESIHLLKAVHTGTSRSSPFQALASSLQSLLPSRFKISRECWKSSSIIGLCSLDQFQHVLHAQGLVQRAPWLFWKVVFGEIKENTRKMPLQEQVPLSQWSVSTLGNGCFNPLQEFWNVQVTYARKRRFSPFIAYSEGRIARVRGLRAFSAKRVQ